MGYKFGFFVILVLFVLSGCHQIRTYYEACKGDEVCVRQMESAASQARSVTVAAANSYSVPSSVADVIGGIVGSVVAFFVGVWRGKKISLAAVARSEA